MKNKTLIKECNKDTGNCNYCTSPLSKSNHLLTDENHGIVKCKFCWFQDARVSNWRINIIEKGID